MRKEMHKMPFSCIIDGMYKEFTISKKSKEELSEILKREEFYNNKYASAYSLEEQRLSMEKRTIINMIRAKGFNYLNMVSSLEDKLQVYALELLSKIELNEVFCMPMSEMNDYFQAMRNLVLRFPEFNKEFLDNQMYYKNAIENTRILSEAELKIVPEQDIENCVTKYKLEVTKAVKTSEQKPKEYVHLFKKGERKIS